MHYQKGTASRDWYTVRRAKQFLFQFSIGISAQKRTCPREIPADLFSYFYLLEVLNTGLKELEILLSVDIDGY